MAKATSASAARKNSQLAKFRKSDAAAFGAREQEKIQSIKKLEVQLAANAEAYKTFGIFRDLQDYASSEIDYQRMLARLSDDDMVSHLDIERLLFTDIPEAMIVGDKYTETITSIRGISIDVTKYWNAVRVAVAGKLAHCPRVLALGLDTDRPGEVIGWDGPPPSEMPNIPPGTAAIYFKIPGVFVRRQRDEDFKSWYLRYLDAQFIALQELIKDVCRGTIRKFELKEAPAQGMDLTDLLVMQQGAADEERDKNFQRPDRLVRQAMKAGGTHFHESHMISSNTTEASAEAIANVMIEYAFGKVILSEPELIQENGQQFYVRNLLIDKLGLADIVHSIEDEDLRRHIRLVAFLDRYNSMKHIDVTETARNREERVTKMSGHDIAKEWQPDTIDRWLVRRETSGMQKTFERQEKGRVVESTVFMEMDMDDPKNSMQIARMVMDGWTVETRERITRTELMSHDESISRRKMEKALNIYYKTLRAIKEQIIEDEVRLDVKSLALRQGPLLENGEFVHKLVQHPESSGLSDIRIVTEMRRGTIYKWKRPASAAQGCYIPVKVEDTMTKFLSKTQVLPAFRDSAFKPITEPFEVAEDFPKDRTWDPENPDYQYAVFPVTVTQGEPLQFPEPRPMVINIDPDDEDEEPLDEVTEMLLELLWREERARELGISEQELLELIDQGLEGYHN